MMLFEIKKPMQIRPMALFKESLTQTIVDDENQDQRQRNRDNSVNVTYLVTTNRLYSVGSLPSEDTLVPKFTYLLFYKEGLLLLYFRRNSKSLCFRGGVDLK